MIRDALLAVGVLFATFTQLRPTGVPLGPGELCLAAWLCLMLGRSLGALRIPIPPAFLRILLFWLIFAAALCIGTATAVVVGERNVKEYFIHDLIAYTLVAGISLLAAFQIDAAVRLRRAAWFLVLIGSWFITTQLAQAFGLLPPAGLDLWFYDERFIGWTTNANQVALLCLILVLLSLHLAETASRPIAKLAALAAGVFPALAGFLSRSDAFMLALILSVCCVVGFRWYRLLAAPQHRLGLAALSALLGAFALPALVAATTPLAYRLASGIVTQHASDETSQKLERDVGSRTKLWEQAFKRGLESRMLGLGPGPHLVRPPELREPRWDWLPDFEAHNTFVDVFLQGGLLATAALLWLLATAVRAALNTNLTFLAALALAMIGFAFTHFVIRHPIVWFVLAFVLAAGLCHGHCTVGPNLRLPGKVPP